MSRVIHFEIHAENPERALAFYAAVLGWTSQKWDGPEPYWLLTTGPDGSPGINGGLLLRRGPSPAHAQPVNAFICTIEVDSVDKAVASAEEHGGGVALPKMAIPGVGWLAYCTDTEGNIFGVMTRDPSAH